MFEKLRNAFSNTVKSFGEKELKAKDIDEVLFELEVALLESDVATEVIDALKDDLKIQLIGATVNKDKIAEFVKQDLQKSIANMFDAAGRIDILSNIQKKKENKEPYIVSFMGINGTGKTTTVAKFANLLRENKYSVVIAAADTFRAGAIEQISEHGKRLNIKVIAQNYGSDPASVARDAVLYAKSHKIDCVLIDTAGRMQTSKNLMDQISKINQVVNPDFKLFVGDALAGNDTVSQAREFFNYTKFDGAILTKSDADARGGAAISIVKITSRPILYLGIGQEYRDLKSFDKDMFLETLFGPQELIEARQSSSNKGIEKRLLEKPSLKQISSLAKSIEFNEPKTMILPEQIIEKIEKEKKTLKVTMLSELEIKAKPESEIIPEKKPQIKSDGVKEKDPFTGIITKDIEIYSEVFDVPPPENDDEAINLAINIRKWVFEGRPVTKKQKVEEEIEKKTTSESSDGESSKKRSLFRWRKK